MEDSTTFYKSIAKKNDLDIIFIIENPDDYDKEYYCAAIKIGLQRGIVSRSDFEEEYLKELNKNIDEIVEKENAKPKKPFNFLLWGFVFFVGGVILLILNLSLYVKFQKDIYHFDISAFLASLIGLILLTTGLIKRIRKSKENF
jgi:hypothetical protein